MANNYRGVHLTAIFSKLAEKIIARDLLRHLHAGAFGPHQWAFTPGLSSRDLVTALVMSWVLAFCTGFKVAGYLGDISGQSVFARDLRMIHESLIQLSLYSLYCLY